jgi:arylsulfatase A-like enzyme
MKRFSLSCFLVSSFLALITLSEMSSVVSADKPNLVFILADDLGYGDLGSYGQQKIKTPALDALAKEGIRFTRHYSGSTVCAPSRAVLMTGMHPGHCVIRTNVSVPPEGQFPMPQGTVTMVGELKKRGYVCGAFGKWGLGPPDSHSSPLKTGFDRFYGYNCQGVAHSYYPKHLWDDDKQVVINENPVPGHAHLDEGADPKDSKSYEKFKGENYSADLIANEALRFVEKHAGKQPFFLYWPTTVPHVALQVPDDSLKEYLGLWDDPPYPGVIGRPRPIYLPQFTPRAAYAAMVTRMDREIGRLIQLLKEKGVYENTLIVFTSDNGPLSWETPEDKKYAGVDAEFFNSNAGLRGAKGDMYEAGIRVPCIVSWQGKIKAGTVTDQMSGFEDWFPTFLELAGGTTPPSDGISLVPVLFGEKGDRPARDWLYREITGSIATQVVMVGDWKALRTGWTEAKNAGKSISDVPIELYNLKEDLYEKTNVAERFPEKVKELRDIMDKEHVRNELHQQFLIPLLDD